jgi:predicted HTH domain antitoxin
MPRQVDLRFALPDGVAQHLCDAEMAAKAKEALVMELLREHHISQGKAAELLNLSRHDLFDVVSTYHIPVIDLTAEELEAELTKPWRARGKTSRASGMRGSMASCSPGVGRNRRSSTVGAPVPGVAEGWCSGQTCAGAVPGTNHSCSVGHWGPARCPLRR